MKRAPLKSLIGPVMVLVAAVVIGNLVAGVVWTVPHWRARTGVVGGAGGVERARQRVEPSLQLVRDTYGRLNQADTDLETFRRRLVATVGGAELLSMLDGAGDGVGIDLDDATLQYLPLDELGVVQLSITLPVAGTYEAVRRLLDELVALPVFLVVDGVGLQTFGAAAAASPEEQAVRVDLAISVFLADPELGAPARASTRAPATRAPRRALVSERQTDKLRQAARGDDPQDIADELIATLALLPALPVDPASLVVNLDKLDTPLIASEPRRNLFSVVLPPAPEPLALEQPEDLEPPPPTLPVRLLGVLRIEGRWHASLTDEFDVFIVEAGDSLPNGVRIVEVGADYTEVVFGSERTRLTLEGSRP